MKMNFNKEEQEKLKQTLTVVVEDLRSLFNIGETNKLIYEFKVRENGDCNLYSYSLVIKKKEMYIARHYSGWYMNLDKVKANGKARICSITDYNLVFSFLQQYEEIRKDVKNMVIKNQNDKIKGMERAQDLFNKYTKEAIIEVEMPETINQTSIEVIQENDKNIGKINVGPISLRILASEGVRIVERKSKEKVKKKVIKN